MIGPYLHEAYTFVLWAFLIELFIEVIADLHEVIRNNIERSCVPFIHFTPMATSCETTAHCHNQDVDIDALHLFLRSADFIQIFFK